MKKAFVTLLVFLFFSVIYAQNQQFPDLHPDSVMRQDPRMAQMHYEPGELLIRFQDDVEVTIFKSDGKAQTGIAAIDAIFNTYEVVEAKQLIPGAKPLQEKQMLRTFTGMEFERPSLHNIYHLKFAGEDYKMFDLIEALKEEKNIIYAEPNFIYSLTGHEALSPELTAEDLSAMYLPQQNTSMDQRGSREAIVPNDPFYDQQWWIQAINADLAWEQSTGDTTQVIAILDTGVDWNHPDLVNKIWTNTNETLNGQDSDGNGFVDDIRGWDFINNRNNPMDDNSHGTHVAGIAAAETNNGVGIAGISWGARIMPIKVMSSSGTGNIAQISLGVDYAINNGATIINLSLGSYSRSLTLENILSQALSNNILINAAAGNDAFSIYGVLPTGFPSIFYPAALPFVFGVQADGAYSNYDPDGPVYSNMDEGLNYELKSYGRVLSTTPNGNYRIYAGTSMASPMISGALALYRSLHPDKELEELYSDLIYSSNNFIDVNKAINNLDKTYYLDVLKAEYYDTCSNCDNDGHADAGEVLDYIFEIRNSGSPADSVYAKIRHNYIEDTINFSVLTDSVFFGSIGVFRTLRNDDNPFKIKILEDCYNNTIVSLHVTMGNLNDEIIFEQEISFRILNGTEVSGILLQDTVFTPDKKWLISSSLRISEGVTLTILPGTDVEILAGVDNRGLVFAEGTAENRITMNGIIGGNAIYKYADIDVKGGYLNINNIDNCHIKNITRLDASTITNTRFTNVWLPMNNFHSDSVYRCFFDDVMSGGNNLQGKFYESVFSDLITLGERIPNPYFSYSKYNVFNKLTSYYYWSYPTNPGIYLQYPTFLFRLNDNQNRVIKNSFINNSINSYFVRADGSENYITVSEQFWGSSNQDIIRPKYYDFINDAGLPYAILEPKLDAPSDSCHAHVWKVLVNGLDAQDTIVEPVGVGQQRFDVYFNRPMKQSVNPEVSFGGLFPYISTAVDENPSWSDDGLVFTVYKTINLTNADGLNTIRVAGGIQDADWGWEVPLENQRFKFRISAASSASNLFMATPGLGKVSLEWNNNDLDDGLGYNMYRMEQINDSTLSSPILINPTLIIDTLYTDYAVTHNKKYFYYFKILRTNFSETDSSKVVAAIPFTASIGDANGDLIVNLLDIIDIVSYILNNNPQPFIFEAADVNGDEQINLLDIISVVNIIMGEKKQALFSTPAYAYLEPKEISLKSDGTLSGFQFQLISPEIEKLELRNLLPGFEFIKRIHDDTLTGLVFSMDNKAIPEGKINLFEITNHPGTLNWGELFAGNLQGDYVPVYKDAMQLPEDYRYNFELYPNPSYGDITLEMFLPEQSDLEIIIYNTLGQVVYQRLEKDLMKGNYTMQLNIKGQLARGLHYVNIAYLPKNKTGMMNYRKVKKMILN